MPASQDGIPASQDLGSFSRRRWYAGAGSMKGPSIATASKPCWRPCLSRGLGRDHSAFPVCRRWRCCWPPQQALH